MGRKLLALILLVMVKATALAQITTEGTEFWFGFMQNADPTAASSVEIFLTSKTTAQVEIFLYRDSRSINVTVQPGVTHKEVINFATNNPFAAIGSGRAEQKAIRVTSDADISVYAFSNRRQSGDAAVILPVNSLGKDYIVSAYYEEPPATDAWAQFGFTSPSQMLIVATVDNTQIEITPKVTTMDGQQAGVTYTITLNTGDIYQLRAMDDLTGTTVVASAASDDCQNFAVFGGNYWTRVTGGKDCAAIWDGNNVTGGAAGDHLYEQMYPVNTWGQSYLAIPFEERTGYVLQITAAEDDTQVSVGLGSTTLAAGEKLTMNQSGVTQISADKPIQVAQLAQSLSCDFIPGVVQPSGPGDPFMIMLSPNEQRLTEITFNALTAQELDTYYVTIITDSDAIDQLSLTDVIIGPLDFLPVPGASNVSYANISIEKGRDYTLQSDNGFVAYVYGFGTIESFGYVAGAALENLNLQIEGDDETIGLIIQEGCKNSLVDFTAQLDVRPGETPRFNTFNWDFGDGNTGEGDVTAHTYAEAGSYEVTLVASDGLGAQG